MRKLMAWLLALISSLTWASLPCMARGSAGEPQPEPKITVEDLQCRGNVTTSCSFILGHLYLNPADRLDETEIQNARLRLASLRNFSSVDIYLEKGSQKGRAIVVVEVSESDAVSTEWIFGTSARLDAINQVLGGRIAHENLWGAGKILDFTALGEVPIEGPLRRNVSAVLRYADPHLFNSKRYFAIGSLRYRDAHVRDSDGSYGDNEQVHVRVAVGRRLWDFSYLSAAYIHYPSLELRSGRWQSGGVFESKEYRNRHAFDVVYGWNSENDYYFPTRGSGFNIGFGWYFGSDDPNNELHLQFRKTWQTESGSLWTLKIGGDPIPEYRQSFNESQLVAVAYARPLRDSESFPDIGRGRWYVELGHNSAGFRPDGSRINETGIKAGVRIESARFGLIDLYVIASSDIGSRDPKR